MAIDTGSYFRLQLSAYDSRIAGLGSATVVGRVPVTAVDYSFSYTAGSGALQFNQAYSAARTLPGATEDIDLAGVLADTFGGAINAAEVKAWAVRNTSASNTLTVGGTGGSNWTTCLNGTITLPPGAAFGMATPDATGWTVAAGTGDLLRLAGTSGQGYELTIWVN